MKNRTSEVTIVTITKLSNWSLRAVLAVAGLAFAMPAQAGWQSPFELTCFRKKQPQAVYYVAPVAPTSCCAPAAPPPVVAQYAPPQNVCTQYVPKTYYQQVTNYQPTTVVEPRTEYRTSYYYEPVTSYRYSYAYDPCNCSYQTVATPQTSYQLKSQSVPVTTYVQKTQMVPVTQYRQMTYYEPQTTITPAPAPVVGPWTTTPPATTVTPAQAIVPAGVQETRNPAAGVQETRTPNTNTGESPLYKSYSNPPANGTGRAPAQQNYPAVAPRADRITSNTGAWKPVQATLAKHAIPE
ncbi:MAG: hypothetical protein U0796_14545 [Gemmatales bacterium]